MIRIEAVHTPEDIETARILFQEYADSLGVDLCFQNFSRELAGLPGEYAPPGGALLIARAEGAAAGCAALRAWEPGIGEMKRLYVRPRWRGCGLGRRLAETVVETARGLGYRRILLDTLPGMAEAIALYRSMGFREAPPYRTNPIPGALFLELEIIPSPKSQPSGSA